jgi:hypothetical protein
MLVTMLVTMLVLSPTSRQDAASAVTRRGGCGRITQRSAACAESN